MSMEEASNSSPGGPEDQFLVEQIIDDLIFMVNDSRSVTRSGSVSLNRKEALRLLNQAKERFPDEIRAARWLIKERKLFIERVQQEKEEIVDEAQKRSAELVSRVEVVREAQKQARHIVQSAEEQAARAKYELESYCEKQLARFEEMLGRIQNEVIQGRHKLQSATEESIREIREGELDFEGSQNRFESHNEPNKLPTDYFEQAPNYADSSNPEPKSYEDPLLNS